MHTQGEWTQRASPISTSNLEVGVPYRIAGDNCFRVLAIVLADEVEDVAANARLIAAAPELLAACQSLLDALMAMNAINHPELSQDVKNAQAAIIHATGKR